ncbi:hypothetical protein F2P56_024785 [Juglans regia]|uniref:Glutaredoxin domain-containing protein n=2 Tax=Juglans regia TaxID=51240 RepID=A0A833X0Y7_JUGRE|nr:monothiol glutaredoxin-S6-like [Juglans regia]KAF5455182.1 hypothetical protein F2P56_024785 [Juglans regia]
MDTVASLASERPVVIFSKTSCCMSYSIKTLITGFGANPTVYELDQMSNGHQIERELLQRGCQPSVPAVFIGQTFIGGTREVMSLNLRSELVPLLKRAGAIFL